jgi:hypothetical protein
VPFRDLETVFDEVVTAFATISGAPDSECSKGSPSLDIPDWLDIAGEST